MTCTICRHEDRVEIDQAIVEGTPVRTIADRAGCSHVTILRHKAHVEANVAKAAEEKEPTTPEAVHAGELLASKEARDFANGPGLIERLVDLTRETREILAEARLAKDRDVAIKALTRLEKQLELEAKILGQIRESQVNVFNVDPVTMLRNAAQLAAERHRSLP